MVRTSSPGTGRVNLSTTSCQGTQGTPVTGCRLRVLLGEPGGACLLDRFSPGALYKRENEPLNVSLLFVHFLYVFKKITEVALMQGDTWERSFTFGNAMIQIFQQARFKRVVQLSVLS